MSYTTQEIKTLRDDTFQHAKMLQDMKKMDAMNPCIICGYNYNAAITTINIIDYLNAEVIRLKSKCNEAMERANLLAGEGRTAYSSEVFESEEEEMDK